MNPKDSEKHTKSLLKPFKMAYEGLFLKIKYPD